MDAAAPGLGGGEQRRHARLHDHLGDDLPLAQARGVDGQRVARGEAEIENYVDEIDVLMVGPHLAYIVDEVDDYVGDRPVAVILMSPDYYSTLDGNLAVDHLISTLTDEDA